MDLDELSDRAALEVGVQKTKARGATSLNNALYISLKQFGRGAQHQDDVRRQAIAVLSDGEDTSSLVSFDDVLELARKSGVSIYPIVLQSRYAATRSATQGQRRYFSESEYSMRSLAQETGEDPTGLTDAPLDPNLIPNLRNSADRVGVSRVRIVPID